MQYSAILLSALAATSALAAPVAQVSTAVQDVSIRVQLSDGNLATQTAFEQALPQSKSPVGSSGPFNEVTLNLGDDFENQALRCQILDNQQRPIVLLRDPNEDITFGDGNGGRWTFKNGLTEVSQIICDETFAKANAPPAQNELDTSITVTLFDGALISKTAFLQAGEVREVQQPQGSFGPFTWVNITIGTGVKNQELRCKVVDEKNNEVTAQRGDNIDTTFADGGSGPWKFIDPVKTSVSKIVCDPDFVKAVQ